MPRGATGHQHGSQWPRRDDPVLEHLLRDFRSATLRKQFFAHDPSEYTDTLDVKLLVRTQALVMGLEAVQQQLYTLQALVSLSSASAPAQTHLPPPLHYTHRERSRL